MGRERGSGRHGCEAAVLYMPGWSRRRQEVGAPPATETGCVQQSHKPRHAQQAQQAPTAHRKAQRDAPGGAVWVQPRPSGLQLPLPKSLDL